MRFDTIIKALSGAVGAVVGFLYGEITALFLDGSGVIACQ